MTRHRTLIALGFVSVLVLGAGWMTVGAASAAPASPAQLHARQRRRDVRAAVTSHNATTPATATFDSVTIQQPCGRCG